MIAALIRWSIGNRFLVLMATAFLVAAGLWSVARHAARCAARSLRHAGHRPHAVPGQGAADRRGPGHLSADDHDAERARARRPCAAIRSSATRSSTSCSTTRPIRTGRARACVEYLNQVQSRLPRRRQRFARSRCDRRRLGLRVRAGRSQRHAGPESAARAERLVPEVRAEDGAGRRRSREHRRHGAPVPGRARPGPHARARHHAGDGDRGAAEGQPGGRRLGGRARRGRVHGARRAATCSRSTTSAASRCR